MNQHSLETYILIKSPLQHKFTSVWPACMCLCVYVCYQSLTKKANILEDVWFVTRWKSYSFYKKVGHMAKKQVLWSHHSIIILSYDLTVRNNIITYYLFKMYENGIKLYNTINFNSFQYNFIYILYSEFEFIAVTKIIKQ